MKKHFLTGVAVLLPAAVSLFCLAFIVNFLTRPFEGLVKEFFNYYQIFLFAPLLSLMIKGIILCMLFALTLLIGSIAQHVVFKRLIDLGDRILHRLPLLNRVYRAAQEVVHTLFSKDMRGFSKVVLIAFPATQSYSIGFLPTNIEEDQRLVIFIPGTPNILTGFLLNYQANEIIDLPISVEEGLKIVLSLGNFAPLAFIQTLKERL